MSFHVPFRRNWTMKFLCAILLAFAIMVMPGGSVRKKEKGDGHDEGRRSMNEQKAAVKEVFENATLPPSSVEAMHKLLEALQRVKDNLQDLQPLGDQLGQIYDAINGSGTPLDKHPWIKQESKDRQLIKKTFGYKVTVYASPNQNDSKPNITEEIIVGGDEDDDESGAAGNSGDLESSASASVKRRTFLKPMLPSIQYTKDNGYEDDDSEVRSLTYASGHEHADGHQDVNTFNTKNHDQTAKTTKSENAKHSEEYGARLRNHHSGISSHDEHAHDKGAANERAFREKTHIEYFEKEHFLDAAFDKAEKAHDRHKSLTELEAHNEYNQEGEEKQLVDHEKTDETGGSSSHYHSDGPDRITDDSRRIERLVRKGVVIKDDQKSPKKNDSTAAETQKSKANKSTIKPSTLRPSQGRPTPSIKDKQPTSSSAEDLKRLASRRNNKVYVYKPHKYDSYGSKEEDSVKKDGHGAHEVHHHDESSKSGSESEANDKRAHHREEGDKAYLDAAKGHRKQGYRERGFKIMTEVELIDRGVHHDTAYGRRDRAKSVKHRERERHRQQKDDEKKNFKKEQTLHKDWEDIKNLHEDYDKDKSYGTHDENGGTTNILYDDYYLPSDRQYQKNVLTSPYPTSHSADMFTYPSRPQISAVNVHLGKDPQTATKLKYKLRIPRPEKHQAKANDIYRRIKEFYRTRNHKLQQSLAENSRKPKSSQVTEHPSPDTQYKPKLHRGVPAVSVNSFLRDIAKERLLKSAPGNYILTPAPSHELIAGSTGTTKKFVPTNPLKRPPLRYINDHPVSKFHTNKTPLENGYKNAVKFDPQDARPFRYDPKARPTSNTPSPSAKVPSSSTQPQTRPPRVKIPSHIIIETHPLVGHMTTIPAPPVDKSLNPKPQLMYHFQGAPSFHESYGPTTKSYKTRYENIPPSVDFANLKDGDVLYIQEYNNPIRRIGLQAESALTNATDVSPSDRSSRDLTHNQNVFGLRIQTKGNS